MNEELILNGNLSQYEVPYEDVRSEYFKKYDFGNGVECVTYIPENVNANTKITVYYPGSGFKADWYSGHHGSGNLSVQDYLMENGSDSIVIMPHSGNNAVRTEYAVEMINVLQEEYNLTSTDCSFGGFSLGASASLEATALNIHQNPDIDPQICYTIDGYSDFYYNPSYEISKVGEAFKENGTILIGLEAQHKKDVLDDYAKAGINVIRAVYNQDGQVDVRYGDTFTTYGGNNHVAINQHYFKDGFMDFTNGSSVLPTEGYTYQYYDLENNQWVDIDVSQIDTYDKLNAFFGNDVYASKLIRLSSLTDFKLESDDQVLETHLNNIIGKIRTTSFVTGNYSGETSFESTTKVPSGISSVVTSFFETNANLLSKIVDDVKQFSKIGVSIRKLEQQMEENAEELNNGVVTLVDTTTGVTTQNEEKTEPSNEEIIAGTLGATTIIATQSATSLPKEESLETTPQKTEAPTVQTQPQTQPQTNNNPTSSNTNQNQTPTTSDTTNNQGAENSSDKTHPIDEFPKYEEVYSDESKIVYNYNDEYKIIVHKDGDKIIGIEHYYDFKTPEAADKALSTLKLEYNNHENLDNIIQNDRYVKVVFTEDMYKNLTLNDIQEKYSELSEVIKL